MANMIELFFWWDANLEAAKQLSVVILEESHRL